MVKQLYTKQSLLILVDSFKVNYQTLLITCLKLERKNIRSECESIGLKNNRLNYKCKECNRTSAKSVNDLIEKFPTTYKFCNSNLNKFVLLLRKNVYLYEYMDG